MWERAEEEQIKESLQESGGVSTVMINPLIQIITAAPV